MSEVEVVPDDDWTDQATIGTFEFQRTTHNYVVYIPVIPDDADQRKIPVYVPKSVFEDGTKPSKQIDVVIRWKAEQ